MSGSSTNILRNIHERGLTDEFVLKSECSDKDSAKHFLLNCEWCLEEALKFFESTWTAVKTLTYILFEHGKDGDLVFDKRTHLFGRIKGNSIDFICDGMEMGKTKTIQADDDEEDLIVLKCTTLQSHMFHFEVGGEDRPFSVGDYRCLEKAPENCSESEVEKYWYTENVAELSVNHLRAAAEELSKNWAYDVIVLTP